MSSTSNTEQHSHTQLGTQLRRRKSIQAMANDAADNAGLGTLKRSLGVTQLVMI